MLTVLLHACYTHEKLNKSLSCATIQAQHHTGAPYQTRSHEYSACLAARSFWTPSIVLHFFNLFVRRNHQQ